MRVVVCELKKALLRRAELWGLVRVNVCLPEHQANSLRASRGRWMVLPAAKALSRACWLRPPLAYLYLRQVWISVLSCMRSTGFRSSKLTQS